MMGQSDRDNSGTISKNEQKKESKHPDYKGGAMIDGVQYWVSAWIKKGENGNFLSLAFSPKEGQSSGNTKSGTSRGRDDDEIGF